MRYDNSSLICDLTNSTLRAADGSLLLAQDLFHLRRIRFLWEASALERLALHNFDREPARLRLRIDFASDFADLFEVRGARRPARGTIHPPEVRHDGATLAYTGLDDRRRETRLRFEPAPDTITAEQASFDLVLAPGERRQIYLGIHCGNMASAASPRRRFFTDFRAARRARRQSVGRAASIAGSHEIFNEAISPRRTSCRILPGSASAAGSSTRACSRASTLSTPRAISGSSHSVSSAVISASRPKNVLNQGMPA